MRTAAPSERLLNPKSVAVLGASPTPGKPGYHTLENLVRFGYRGSILPINPAHERIGSWDCVPSLDDLEHRVDLVIAAIPRDALLSPSTLRALSSKCHNIVVFAAGFAEVGAHSAQAALEVLAANGVGIVGPNTMGFISGPASLGALFARFIRVLKADMTRSPIAVLSQSGGVATRLFNMLFDLGLRPNYCINTGNEAGYTVADMLRSEAVLSNADVQLVYAENLHAASDLCEAVAEAAEAGKHVVAVVGGVTTVGAAAARSHTGAIASDANAAKALLREAGALVVANLEEMTDAAVMLASQRTSRAKRLGVVTFSGGSGVLLSDFAVDEGFELPPLHIGVSEDAAEALRGANPVDVTALAASGKSVDLACVVAELDRDPDVDVVALDLPIHDWPKARRAIRRGHKPMAIELSDATQAEVRRSVKAGVPAFTGPHRAVRALRATVVRAPIRSEFRLEPAVPSQETLSTYGDLLEHINQLGVRVVPFLRVRSAREARAAYERLGPVVVVKGDTPAAQHKTEARAVYLGVTDHGELVQKVERLLAQWGGAIIQRQEAAPLELLIGARRVQGIGCFGIISIGGIQAELVSKPGVVSLPTTSSLFDKQIDRLAEDQWPLAALFTGYRGITIDRGACLQVLSAAFQLLNAHDAVDLNPVFVQHDGGLTVADARVVANGGELHGGMSYVHEA